MKYVIVCAVGVVVLLFCGPGTLSAQSFTITGTVKEKEALRPIAYSSVQLFNSSLGAISDASGKFHLTVPAFSPGAMLVVSFLGYATDTLELVPGKAHYAILLTPIQSMLNDVVVTGVSKATLARENPVPVISVSSKQIEQAVENNIIDALVKYVPGLNAVKTGPNISKPFIRGLGYNRVLTLYDGVRQEGQQWGDEHGIEVDAYNVDKAEIIKGPASLMYGSDALAGVLSLLSALPSVSDNKPHGKYFSEYQSNNGLVGNGLRLDLLNNRWSFAFRASYRIARNYSNDIDKRVYNTGFRESNLSAGVRHTGSKGYTAFNFTLYDTLQGIPDGSRDSATRKFTYQVYEASFDQIKARPVVSDGALASYRLSALHQHIMHYRVYSNSHYNFAKGDIDFVLAGQQNIRIEYTHPTIKQQAGMYVRLNTVNYGFRYNAPAIAGVEFTLGINGMYQKNSNKAATDFPVPDYSLFDAGSYLFAKWKRNSWTVSGGARYDIRRLSGSDFYTKGDAATGFYTRVSLPDTAGAYLQFSSFKKMFRGTSFSLGTTVQVNNNISIKANIANGYRAPNITEFASNGLDPGAHIIYLGNRNFSPEFSIQEDVGVDLTFKEWTAHVSLFNNNIKHYIYLAQVADASGNPLVNAQGNKTYQYQQAAGRLYGAEASLSLHPAFIKDLTFNNALSLIYGYNRKKEFKGQRTNGEYLPLIPPGRLLSSITQKVKVNTKILEYLSITAEADVNALQNRFLALDNTETGTSAYTLIHLLANIPVSYARNKSLQFFVQANNLFNKTYQSHLSRLKYFEHYTQAPNRFSGMYNMGRNICIRAVVPF